MTTESEVKPVSEAGRAVWPHEKPPTTAMDKVDALLAHHGMTLLWDHNGDPWLVKDSAHHAPPWIIRRWIEEAEEIAIRLRKAREEEADDVRTG